MYRGWEKGRIDCRGAVVRCIEDEIGHPLVRGFMYQEPNLAGI